MSCQGCSLAAGWSWILLRRLARIWVSNDGEDLSQDGGYGVGGTGQIWKQKDLVMSWVLEARGGDGGVRKGSCPCS